MGVREWMNENSSMATILAVALLVVAIGIVIFQFSGGGAPSGPGQAYFYDTQTQEYFTADGMQVPPIQSPQGNEAVKAHFYTCGACTEDERFVRYYEKYTPEAKQNLEAARSSEGQQAPQSAEEARRRAMSRGATQRGHLVSKDGEQWVPATSTQGRTIQGQTMTAEEECEGGQQAKPCRP